MKLDTRTQHGSKALRSKSGYDITPLSEAVRSNLAKTLSEEERRVILHQGTERPFCGHLLHSKEDGVYACRLCGLPLFRSGSKFDSGTGWPSFTEPFDPDHIGFYHDDSHYMVRTEIRCRRCDAHLGHVFNDGPPPSEQRYCLNSAALTLEPRFEKQGSAGIDPQSREFHDER